MAQWLQTAFDWAMSAANNHPSASAELDTLYAAFSRPAAPLCKSVRHPALTGV